MIIIGNYQKFRGDAENKLFYILQGFTGLNTEFNDDASPDTDFEKIVNFDIDKLGTIVKRTGFGLNKGVTDALENSLNSASATFPMLVNRTDDDGSEIPNPIEHPEFTNNNIIYFKILRDTNNIFRTLASFESIEKYREKYGSQNNKLSFILITSNYVKISPESEAFTPVSTLWFYNITVTENFSILYSKSCNLDVQFDWKNNLKNINAIELYDKIYFTDNSDCLMQIDRGILDDIVEHPTEPGQMNIFFKENASLNKALANDGTLVDNPDWFTSEFIEVVPTHTYTITGKDGGSTNCWYDENLNFIETFSGENIEFTVPTGKHIAYMRVNSHNSALDTLQINTSVYLDRDISEAIKYYGVTHTHTNDTVYLANKNYYSMYFLTDGGKTTKVWTKLVEGVDYQVGYEIVAYLYEDNINSAYRPSGTELTMQNLGPNLLCTSPLTDVGVDSSLTGVDSIQGAYFLTKNANGDMVWCDSNVIPTDRELYLYIIYTGENNGFSITAKAGDQVVDLNGVTEETSLSTNNLAVYKFSLGNPPSGEIEFKIEKTSADISPYYIYYNTGQLDVNAVPIEPLSLGGYKSCLMGSRLCYYNTDTIYFSDINIPEYIPCNNYVSIPLEPTDNIVNISYFKGSYIIFTNNTIYKFVGNFGSSDFALEPVNLSLGCVAGNTVVPIDDVLYFCSRTGLYALVSNKFILNSQNVKELDFKVKRYTSPYTESRYQIDTTQNTIQRFNGITENACAIRYKDKYMLFPNDWYDNRSYSYKQRVDCLVYDYTMGYFTTYFFKYKPNFLCQYGSTLNCIISDNEDTSGVITPIGMKFYEFEATTTDFGDDIYVELKTKGSNLKYPQHIKKLKHTFLKIIGGSHLVNYTFILYANNHKVNDPRYYVMGIDENGTITMEYFTEENFPVHSISSTLGNMELSETAFAGIDGEFYRTMKMVTPTKSKNFACEVSGWTGHKLEIESIGFVCKLGKVKQG